MDVPIKGASFRTARGIWNVDGFTASYERHANADIPLYTEEA